MVYNVDFTEMNGSIESHFFCTGHLEVYVRKLGLQSFPSMRMG